VSGSSTVIDASAGDIATPAWNAFWVSRKPSGPHTTTR